MFFIVLILTTHSIIYVGYTITEKERINLLFNRYMETLHKVRIKNQKKHKLEEKKDFHPTAFFSKLSKKKFNSYFKEYHLLSPDISYSSLKKKGKLVASDFNWKLYEYKGFSYFYRNDRFDYIFIKDNLKVTNKTVYFVFLTILLNITFLLFYLFLLRKLSPLKSLKINIQKFSKGDLDIDTSCMGKDEISEVSNEFNNAIKEIKQLTESRNLFLRNIMHELKTPITKGKIIGSLMQEEEHKVMLRTVFERLEYLLHEFAKIEQLTSNNIELNKDTYRVIDIIDQATDILMISNDNLIVNNNYKLVINVDFYLFSLVIKNLLDNGLKYGNSKVIIDIDKNYLAIRNEGKPLNHDLIESIKPFNKKYETSAQGLGLGLYIVKTILKLHQLTLKYKHIDNQNIFYIDFK